MAKAHPWPDASVVAAPPMMGDFVMLALLTTHVPPSVGQVRGPIFDQYTLLESTATARKENGEEETVVAFPPVRAARSTLLQTVLQVGASAVQYTFDRSTATVRTLCLADAIVLRDPPASGTRVTVLVFEI